MTTLTVVRLDADRADALDELRRLRDAAAIGAAPEWAVASEPTIDTRLLHHLPPPSTSQSTSGAVPPWLAEWRAAYRFGLLSLRRGPGFAVVRDHRAIAAAQRLVLDERALAVLDAHATPAPVAATPLADAAATDMVELHLLLVAGGLALTLPYRLVRWPIPATAV